MKQIETSWGVRTLKLTVNGKSQVVSLPAAGLLMKGSSFYTSMLGFYKEGDRTKVIPFTVNFTEVSEGIVRAVANQLNITQSKHYCVTGTLIQDEERGGKIFLTNPSLFKSLYTLEVEAKQITVQNSPITLPPSLELIKDQRCELRIYKNGDVENYRGQALGKAEELIQGLKAASASSADMKFGRITLPHVKGTPLFPDLIRDIENWVRPTSPPKFRPAL